jgi:lipopolysaccharide assembly protein A
MTTEPQPTPAGPGPGDLAPGRPPPAALEQTAPPAQTAPAQTAPAQTAPAQTAPAQTAPAQTAAPLPQHKIKRTRISGLWVSVGFFAVVLLLLLIFILQNGTKVDISYMGAHGHLPLGVALLLSAVCGVLLVVLAGAARISQLRAVARRHRRADAKRVTAAQAAQGPVGSTR